MAYETSISAALRRPNLRARLDAGPVVGTFQLMVSPAVTELLALSGADVICLDAEHAAFDLSTLEHHVRAAEAAGGSVVIRVPSLGAYLPRSLDLGSAGVVVPRIESARAASRVVQDVRFPPLGRRGIGAARAARFGLGIAEYLSVANEDLLLVVMIETAAGLAHLDEIVAVDGVDVVMVGPTDLASSLGVEADSPEHSEAVARIFAAVRKAGRHIGIHCAEPAEVARYADLGARFILVGFDSSMLVGAAHAVFSDCRDLLARQRGTGTE